MITPDTPLAPVHAEVRFAAAAERGGARQLIKEAFLRQQVAAVLKENRQQGIMSSLTITDVASGRVIYGYNQRAPHFAASVNKIPLAMLALEDVRTGTLQFDQTLAWEAADRREGLGVYDQPDSPLQAPLRDVLHDMLNRSGNTAVRVVVNQGLGGAAVVNDRLAAYPRLDTTRLEPLASDAAKFYMGDTTSREALRSLTQLLKPQDVYAAAAKKSLATNVYADYGVRSALSANDSITLANKVGILDDAEGNNRHDVGLIYNSATNKTYGYAMLTTTPYNEADPATTQQAERSLQAVGQYLLHFAGDHQ
ncbi:MAG TPA: serine hydrolase [Candidatus Saccharimonadales bacterium]|nr:serine hydrolase [Candidatus Saccharimonadales bacterium]